MDQPEVSREDTKKKYLTNYIKKAVEKLERKKWTDSDLAE